MNYLQWDFILASPLHYPWRKVNAELMNLLLAAVLVALGLILLLVVLQFWKLTNLSHKGTDWAPVLNDLGAIQKGQEQVDRSVTRSREIDRNTPHNRKLCVVAALTGMGDSVSTKVEGLTRSNDQKLELLRSGMEQRLGFSTESGRKIDRAALIVTTNLPFSEWTTVFPNPRLCKALLDRVTDRAHIIETGTESFRFRRTMEKRKKR